MKTPSDLNLVLQQAQAIQQRVSTELNGNTVHRADLLVSLVDKLARDVVTLEGMACEVSDCCKQIEFHLGQPAYRKIDGAVVSCNAEAVLRSVDDGSDGITTVTKDALRAAIKIARGES